MHKKKYVFLFMPLSIVIVLLATTFTPIFRKVEGSLYNTALGFKKPIPQHPALLLVDFGDEAIEKAGTYPVSRSIYADGLVLLREMGGNYVIFDIEFVDPSPRGVNYRVLNEEIPKYLDQEFSVIQKNTSDLFTAIEQGAIPLAEAGDFIPYLNNETANTRKEVIKRIKKIVQNNDTYLGQAAKIFGNTFFTVNINESSFLPEKELFDYYQENFSLQNTSVEYKGSPFTLTGLIPTILDISRYARGAGFPNVQIDSDGVRRRIDLIKALENKHYAQLAFRPLLHWLGEPEVIIMSNSLILKNAKHPDTEDVRDIKIPLNSDGTLNINWLPYSFTESFKHLPFGVLMTHDQLYNLIINNLKIRMDWGYLNLYRGETPLSALITFLEEERSALFQGKDPDISTYRDARAFFLSELDGYLQEPTFTALEGGLNELKEKKLISEADYETLKNDLPLWFSRTRESLNQLMNIRKNLKEVVPGSFAIIGNTATGTTDIGVTPFEKEYMNVGTHASVVNTIIHEQFIALCPRTVCIFISLLLSIALTLIIRSLPPLKSVITGITGLIAVNITLLLFFRLTLIYIDLLFPSATIFLTFVILTASRYLSSEKEKTFINNAFSHYLSVDVIHEIIDDPTKLTLGGEMKYMTAMFTDIRSFSTLSEKMTPEDLVKLLNAYLTEMSDTIMQYRGTIDKYEGDAIISFFGAPVYMEDHAERACISAIMMKRLEIVLNRKFQERQWTSDTIMTRIGINTGDMVVGNMGTDKKMDYTIMGNSVNLASRLEGVNKLYGTWIMVSEETKRLCPTSFFFRRLDRVRVVGIKTPIRLYELVEENDMIDRDDKEAYALFDQGLRMFESREWREAMELFTAVQDALGHDPPCDLYISRCLDYIEEEPDEEWDGVFNLTSK